MTRVRRLTLDEWFLNYQLQHSWYGYHHLPFLLDVDVTALVKATEEKNVRFSPTAAVVKAVSMLMAERPRLNRLLFHTLVGPRMLELDTNRVNLPVMIDNGGDPVLSAMVLDDAKSKSVTEIHKEIRDFSKSDLSDKPLGRFVATRGNWWWNRLFLRLVHFAAHRMPRVYATEGGGLSVTSLMRRNTAGLILRGPGYGQTSLTFCVCGLQENAEGKYVLNLGIDYNHSIMKGDEFSEACMLLGKILGTDDASAFYPEFG